MAIAGSWTAEPDKTVSQAGAFKPTVLAKTGAFDIFVVEAATLDARQSVTLSSSLPSDRAKIIFLETEGEFLEQGALVARFDTAPFEADIQKFTNELNEAHAYLRQNRAEFKLAEHNGEERVSNLRHQIELASLKLNRLEEAEFPARIERARQDVTKARADHQRVANALRTEERLLEQGLARQARVQETRDREQELLASLKLSEQTLGALQSVTIPAERRQAELELSNLERERDMFQSAQAQALEKQLAAIMRMEGRITGLEQSIQQSRDYLEATEIRAPVSGILRYKVVALGDEKRKPQVGDSVWNRQGFAVIPDMSSMVAYLNVRETDLAKLERGQAAVVRPEAFPGLELSGKVEVIGTLASGNEESDTQNYFRVRIGLAESDQRLRPGMRGKASVLARHYDDVVRVPVESVFFQDNESVCFLWRNGHPMRQPVVLGDSDGNDIVITMGLDGGEEIMLVYPEAFES